MILGQSWLTWSLRDLFGGRVLASGLDSGRVRDTRGGAVLPEVFLQSFDGSIQLIGSDLEVNVHEICKQKQKSGQMLHPFQSGQIMGLCPVWNIKPGEDEVVPWFRPYSTSQPEMQMMSWSTASGRCSSTTSSCTSSSSSTLMASRMRMGGTGLL